MSATQETPPISAKSDLGVRSLSAAVMLVVAGGALWLGGWAFTLFIALVGLGVLWEWRALSAAIAKSAAGQLAWLLAGAAYIGTGVYGLYLARAVDVTFALYIIATVIAVDVGAYFLGRLLGGPKIAPRISPSKTWAGLLGGVIGAAGVFYGAIALLKPAESPYSKLPVAAVLIGAMTIGTFITVIAQAGDFFESWMKRRAGVKDSGSLIPGHGGLFDRVDGLLAVLAVGMLIHTLVQHFGPQSF